MKRGNGMASPGVGIQEFIGHAIQSYFTLMASALKRPVKVLELGVRPEPMA